MKIFVATPTKATTIDTEIVTDQILTDYGMTRAALTNIVNEAKDPFIELKEKMIELESKLKELEGKIR